MFVFQQRATGASGVKAKGMRLLATDDDLRSFLLENFSKHLNCLHHRTLQAILQMKDRGPEAEFADYLDVHCRVTILFVGELAPEAKLVKTPDLLDMFKDKEPVIEQYVRNAIAAKTRENHERFNSK